MEPIVHIVELAGGYVDKHGVKHTRVTFGHRLNARDLFSIDEDPQGQNPTQYNDLIVRAHITEFGTLPKPVALSILLNLDSVDREDLAEACNVYQAISAEGRTAEFLPDHKVKLAFGFTLNGLNYNQVVFGHRITGMDDVEADRIGLKGIRRACFLMGKQIASIASQDGTAQLAGPIPLHYFSSPDGPLDGMDIAALRGAAELWRQSFRISGAALSRNGRGSHSVATGQGDRLERRADSGDATRAS